VSKEVRLQKQIGVKLKLGSLKSYYASFGAKKSSIVANQGVELSSGSMFGARPKFNSFFSFFGRFHHRFKIQTQAWIQAEVLLSSNPSLSLIFLHIKLEQKTKFKFQVLTLSLLLSS
jgi:hypothetical protein